MNDQFTDASPFDTTFDCHYGGDTNRCDKDCKQLGACKRRTSTPSPIEGTSTTWRDQVEGAVWDADHTPHYLLARDMAMILDRQRASSTETGSEPTAYLFNGTLYWPDGLTDEQRARATPLDQSHPSSIGASMPKAIGVSRMVDAQAPHLAEKMLLVSFDRRPTDDELRAIHELLAGRVARSAKGGKSE